MKRSAVLGIAFAAVLHGSPARAQQAGKTYRVGVLGPGSLALHRPYVDVLRRALSALGHQEGTNLEIVDRVAGGDVKRLPALAAELVRLQPGAIVAVGSAAIAAGGLMYYSSSDFAMWRQAAGYVDQILKGAQPAARPTTFDLVVNLTAARTIGITVPQSILLRADRIIR